MYPIKTLAFSLLRHSVFTSAIVMITLGTGINSAEGSAALNDDWNNTNYRTYMEARSAYNKGEYAKAASLWEKLAEKGFARAQTMLAILYIRGDGVSQDYSKAVQLNRKPAEEGYPAAQNLMGVMFENGLGVEKNHAEAIRWYTLAADQGFERAKENLASLINAQSDSKGRDLLSEASRLSGTYASEITTSDSYFFPNPNYRRLQITLEQSGNRISGFSSSPDSQLVGTLTGDTIKFIFWSGAATKGYEIEGTWKITEKGKILRGSWQGRTGGISGKWDLKRIE